jgi:hypothetical protein
MAMTFLSAVNRILQLNGLIRGDTDTLTSFSDSTHNSSSAIAQIAVQDEIGELTSRGLLPYQHKESQTLTLVTATNKYTFPADFVQMYGDPPFFYDSVQNTQIFEYPGGEEKLRNDILTYRTDAGNPIWFYFNAGANQQQVSFYPVTNAATNGKVLTYDYTASVNVSASSDTIPLYTTDQQYAFTDMAARRFKFIYEGKIDVPVDTDSVYRESRSRLFGLLRAKPAPRRYGKMYVTGQSMVRF